MVEDNLPKNNTLWHYTTLLAAQNMVMNDQLWATDYRFLNDRKEYIHGLKALLSLFESYNGERDSNIITQTVMERNYSLNLWAHDIFYKRYQDLMANKNTVMRSVAKDYSLYRFNSFDAPFYCMSFSEGGDSLNQWMGYLNKAGGCAIGFNTEKLLRYIEIKPTENKFHRCIYSDYEFEKNCKEQINILQEKFSNSYLEPGGPIEINFSRIINALNLLCCRYKHACFANEKEWRLIWNKPKKNIYFDTGKPHCKLDTISYGIIDSIEEIIISPQGDKESAQIFFEELIKARSQEAFNEKHMLENGIFLKYSTLPFRG